MCSLRMCSLTNVYACMYVMTYVHNALRMVYRVIRLLFFSSWKTKQLLLYNFCFYFSSFEQEENEMKMMSCIFDDEEVSGESSSAGSSCSVTVGQEQQQSLTKEKINLKSRYSNIVLLF